MKIVGALLSVLLLALSAGSAGCRKGEERAAAPSEAPCRRVIALAPNLSETLFALGLGDRVVGVDDYSHWPPEVEKLPRLGGLFNPNLERIVSLKPDLAVLVPSERDIGEKLKRFGIDSLIVSNETLADIEKSFQIIADRCGVPEAGERLAAEWRQGLELAPVEGRPRVLLSTGRPAGRLADLVVAGPGTFLDELLQRLGAVNAFADAPIRYPEVGMEEVVARAPDVIIELRADPLSPDVVRQLVEDWKALPQVPAVREGRVKVIGGDHVLIPGPRLPQFYRELRGALEREASPQGENPKSSRLRRDPHPLAPSPTRTHAHPGEGEPPPVLGSSLWVVAPLARAGVSACGRGDGGEGPGEAGSFQIAAILQESGV